MDIAMKHITIAGIFLCSLVCAPGIRLDLRGQGRRRDGRRHPNGPDRPTAARSGAPLPAASLPRALRRASAANGEDVRCGCSFSHHRADAGTSAGQRRYLGVCRYVGRAASAPPRLLANTHSDQSVKPSVQRLADFCTVGAGLERGLSMEKSIGHLSTPSTFGSEGPTSLGIKGLLNREGQKGDTK